MMRPTWILTSASLGLAVALAPLPAVAGPGPQEPPVSQEELDVPEPPPLDEPAPADAASSAKEGPADVDDSDAEGPAADAAPTSGQESASDEGQPADQPPAAQAEPPLPDEPAADAGDANGPAADAPAEPPPLPRALPDEPEDQLEPPAPSPSDVDPAAVPPAAEPDSQGELPPPRTSVPDRFLQGEYAGPIGLYEGPDSDGWVYDYAGLQVADLGQGHFSGTFYPGGLPGTGWSRRSRVTLEGQRTGDEIRLEGDRLRATIRLGEAQVETASGQSLGTLGRVLRHSATLGRRAPLDAIVIFDGSHTDALRQGRINQNGNLAAGAEFKESFRDYTLHIEFRVPYQPEDRSQGRGNSGVYLQSRYEVQILDSFGLDPAFNEAGSLYRLRPPEVNMSLPPQRWQTYDIAFRSPRFDADGHKIQDARITVLHNNVLVHDQVDVPRKTGAGQPEGPELLPIRLQDHGDPVEFRNIWLVDFSHLPARPAWSPPWGGCIRLPGVVLH